MCTAFAAHLTAALMRSTDLVPIIAAAIASNDGGGFSKSGRALSITALFTLANAVKSGAAAGVSGGAKLLPFEEFFC